MEGFDVFGDRHVWHYVERINDEPDTVTGSFIDQDGEVRRVDGLFAEVYTEEALRQAESMEKILGGEGSDSAIGAILRLIQHKRSKSVEGQVGVSAEFYKKLSREAADLDLLIMGSEVVSLFGVSIAVKDNLEGGTPTFQNKPDGGFVFDPDGLRPEDV